MKTITQAEPFRREPVIRNNTDPKNLPPPHRDNVCLDRSEDPSDASKEDSSWRTIDSNVKEGTCKVESIDFLLKRVEERPTLNECEPHDPRPLVLERSQGVWCLDDCLAWDESDDDDDDDE